MIKVFLIETAIKNFVSLLRNHTDKKVKKFLLKQSTYDTMLNVSEYYFTIYNRLKKDENGDIEPKQGNPAI